MLSSSVPRQPCGYWDTLPEPRDDRIEILFKRLGDDLPSAFGHRGLDRLIDGAIESGDQALDRMEAVKQDSLDIRKEVDQPVWGTQCFSAAAVILGQNKFESH